MALTYEPIATFTAANSTTGSYIFNSIPQSYVNLRIVCRFAGTITNNRLMCRYNEQTIDGKISVGLFVDSTAATWNYHSYSNSATYGYLTSMNTTTNDGGQRPVIITDIMGYSKSGGEHSSLSMCGFSSASSGVYHTSLISGMYGTGAAITSIRFAPSDGFFKIGDQITLWGLA